MLFIFKTDFTTFPVRTNESPYMSAFVAMFFAIIYFRLWHHREPAGVRTHRHIIT